MSLGWSVGVVGQVLSDGEWERLYTCEVMRMYESMWGSLFIKSCVVLQILHNSRAQAEPLNATLPVSQMAMGLLKSYVRSGRDQKEYHALSSDPRAYRAATRAL